MEFLLSLWTVFLFALACNLDTLILSLSYAAKGVRVGVHGSVVIAAVTTLITYVCLILGVTAAELFPPGTADVLGGIALIGLGLYFLISWLRSGGVLEDSSEPSRLKSLWGCVSLAAALAVNNAGIGVAAGVSGIDPLWAAIFNFFITLVALPLGRWLANRVVGRLLGDFALPLSAALLILLGVYGMWK